MSILFDQIKNQHYSLLDSRFKGHQDIQDGINALFEGLKELPKTEGITNEQAAYLQEINLFWVVFYQELQEEKITSQDEKYQVFRRMGQKLQRHAYYDVAVDLLHVATFGWSISLTIHYDILVKWKTLADDMRELRRSCNEIRQLNGRLKTQKTQKLLIETQGAVKKAQRSLKSSGNNSAEIRGAIKLLRNLEQNIPASKNGTILLSQTVIKKVKGIIDEGKAIFVYGDYIQFDQRGQILNSPQTNIGGDVNGSVLPGNFNAPVTLDHRQVNTSGGDYIQGKNVKVGFDANQFVKALDKVAQLIQQRIPPGKDQDTALFVIRKAQAFGELHRRLHEWKEIHDRLTTIINFVDKFSTGVERYTELSRISVEWGFVTIAFNSYKTYYLEKIIVVDRYEDVNGSPKYGDWIVMVEKGYEDITFELRQCSDASLEGSRNTVLGKSNVLLHILMAYLEQVDKHLLKVANQLQNISEQISSI